MPIIYDGWNSDNICQNQSTPGSGKNCPSMVYPPSTYLPPHWSTLPTMELPAAFSACFAPWYAHHGLGAVLPLPPEPWKCPTAELKSMECWMQGHGAYVLIGITHLESRPGSMLPDSSTTVSSLVGTSVSSRLGAYQAACLLSLCLAWGV